MSMKRKVLNPATYVPGLDKIVIEGPSMTVPDEAYSIRELLRRFQNGLPDNVSVRSYSDPDEDADFDDDDLAAVSRMDMADQLELRELRAQEAREARSQLELEKSEKQKASRKYVKPAPTTDKDEPKPAIVEDAEEGGKDESAS